MGSPSSYSVKTIWFSVLIILVGSASSQRIKCSFDYVYHFGDGISDVGNSVLVRPWGTSLPPTRLPYGKTFPGKPNGRWSDGLIDFDFSAADFGFPQTTPYLAKNFTSSNGVIFSVARSPVLDHKFFKSRGVKIPPYAVPLTTQLRWFKKYLKSVCSKPTDCADRLQKSLILLGDIEGNDIGYALTQGKSIEEVETYVPYITQAQMDTTRELIKLGANLIVIPGNAPLGCYPYVLTEVPSKDPAAYDDLGCLKSVNDLITLKNNHLQQAITNLSREFPDVRMFYGPFAEGMLSFIANTSVVGPDGNTALKACCGIGGKYNYDEQRFCGSSGATVCPNPEEYVFWDGLHLTHEASARIQRILIQPALRTFNCTSQLSASM